MLGVIDLNDSKPETVQILMDRLRTALNITPADRLRRAPACGMTSVAFSKLKPAAKGTMIVRDELRNAIVDFNL